MSKLESPAVDLRGVGLAALGALVLVGGAIGVLLAVYRSQVPNQAPPAPASFPAPEVQARETEQLRRLLAEQRARLAGYGWANQQQGLVKIPIERAMQIIAQRGAKGFDPLVPGNAALSSPTAGAQRATTTGQGAPAGPQKSAPGAAPAAPPNGGEPKP